MKLFRATSFIFVSLCAVLLFFLSFSNAYAQWSYGYGARNVREVAYSIQQTSDGGYIVAGFIEVGTDSDLWLLKLDNNGSIVWQKTYGGSGYVYPNSVQQTSDGGYILAGYTKAFGAGGWDAWVVKLDSSGGVTWQKTYGGTGSDYALDARQTSGGYIVAGMTNSYGTGDSDAWILKLDENGGIVWQKTYGGTGGDWANSVRETTGGYIVAGSKNNDYWVLKIDTVGEVTWQKTYGGSGQDGGYLIRTTKDGGYILAGYGDSSFSAGSWDIWVLKLTDSGAITWQKTYGGTGDDRTYSFEQTEDEGYIIAGYTHSFGPGFGDILLLKLNANGSIAWEKTFGSPSSVDYAYDVKQTSDGGYVVAGFTSSTDADTDILVMKLNSAGSIGTCPFESISTTIVTDTNVVATDTSITPAISTTVGADSAATVIDTSTSIVSICGASSGHERLKIGSARKKQGDGAITSLDGLIDCPDVCEAMYSTDVATILTATPAPLSTFVGWKPTSLGCVGTEPCKVTMDKKKSVKAVFQGPNKLKVVITSKNGGAGRVTTGGDHITCPGDCEELYPVGAWVNLTATPTQGNFIGWTGKSCKDEPSNVCTFTMDKNVTVKAIFEGTP